MRRITISFPEHDLSQLEANAANKKLSLARYLRELVDIGRQVEEATAQQITQPNNIKRSPSLSFNNTKDLWKNMLLCTLESRYLTRYLVDSLPHQSNEKRAAVLSAVKEKAQMIANELLEEQS